MPDVPAVARLYGAARVAIGAGLISAPKLTARAWGMPAGHWRAPLQLLGVRDAIMGVGALAAAADPASHRRALLGCAAADASDALLSAREFLRSRQLRTALAAAAGLAGAIVGVWTANGVQPASGPDGRHR